MARLRSRVGCRTNRVWGGRGGRFWPWGGGMERRRASSARRPLISSCRAQAPWPSRRRRARSACAARGSPGCSRHRWPMGPDLLPQLRRVPEPGVVSRVRSGFPAVPHLGSGRGRVGRCAGAWDRGQDTCGAAPPRGKPPAQASGNWNWQKNAVPAASRGSQSRPCPDLTRCDPCQARHQNCEA